MISLARGINMLTSLGSDLKEIKHATQTIDKNTQSAEKHNNPPQEVRGVIGIEGPIETKRDSYDANQERRDRWRLAVEVFTLFAVIGYGYLTLRVWREMIYARHQSQQQTGLLIKQTEVLKAVVKANPGMQLEAGLMQFGFMNVGRLPASNVCAALIISKRKLPSERLEGTGTTWNPCVKGELETSTGSWDQHETAFYISPAELKRIAKTDLTIRMEGTVTYNDGFYENTFPVCISWIRVQTKDAVVEPGNTKGLIDNAAYDCAEFPNRLQFDLITKQRWESH